MVTHKLSLNRTISITPSKQHQTTSYLFGRSSVLLSQPMYPSVSSVSKERWMLEHQEGFEFRPSFEQTKASGVSTPNRASLSPSFFLGGGTYHYVD